MADVVVVDEQCIRTDVVHEAKKVKAPVISTSDKAVMGLPDRSVIDLMTPLTQLWRNLFQGR